MDVKPGDEIGFSMAYNDNDGTPGVRESTVGWVPGGADSWINADRFGTLRFVGRTTTVNEANSWGMTKQPRSDTRAVGDAHSLWLKGPD